MTTASSDRRMILCAGLQSGGTTLVSFNEHAHLEPAGLVTYR